jgi:hypothetical protein
MTNRPGEGAYRRVKVILGPFSSEPFALGLRALLIDSGDFDVVSIEDLGGLREDAILIIEGTDPTECRTYLDTSVIRFVVLFDPVGARAFVGLDNPDWRRLTVVIKAAAGEMSMRPSAATHERVRVVDPRRLSQSGAYGVDSADLAPLTAWLELSLGLSLLRRLGRDAAGVPGWSIAPREALEMLDLDPRSTTEAVLADSLRIADDALVVSRISLPESVAQIADTFALSELELRLLCLVLAPEFDGRYGTVVGVLQDDLTRRRPGLTLLAELMWQDDIDPWDLRRTVGASQSVVAEGLVRPADSGDLAVDAGFAPSRAIVSHLLAPSVEEAVADAGAALRWPSPDGEPALSADEADLARRLGRTAAEPSPVIHLVGGDAAKAWFGRLAESIGLPLIVGDLTNVAPGTARIAAVGDWVVLSRVVGTGLLVLGSDDLDVTELRPIAARLSRAARRARLVAIDAEPSAAGSWPDPGLVLRAPVVSAAQRGGWWSSAASRAGLALADGDIERLAATAPIDREHIARSMALAASQRTASPRVASGQVAGRSTVELVQQANRDLLAVPLPAGVRRITPAYGWDDIVLSDSRKDLLRAVSQHVVYAGRVLEQWGFAGRVPYGQGVAALLSGPSGTGKTMAAQIIAGELGVDLLQVDLSKTISKYIGETEKNLDGIFDAAERAGAVLLFDEADAIFGKRTEIKDAHDRHANVEVAYLLQRMESFRGLAVLTTNFKQNIDDAFVRRLRFAVEFPLPNAAERARIWRKAFPADTPLAADVDVSLMAGRLQITGGSIQNIALHAAFLAAAADRPVGGPEILAAARRELVKIGMLTAERSLDELVA